jgi:hypothetical protein
VRQWEREQRSRAQQQVRGAVGDAAGGGVGVARTKSALSGAEKARAEERAVMDAKLQAKHKIWYEEQRKAFGDNFHESFEEDDARLPDTMPRRGA